MTSELVEIGDSAADFVVVRASFGLNSVRLVLPIGLRGVGGGSPVPSWAVQTHCGLSPAAIGCAISLGSRRRLCAAQLNTNSQSTFDSPRSFTCRRAPVCFNHPKPFSISQRRLRLFA